MKKRRMLTLALVFALSLPVSSLASAASSTESSANDLNSLTIQKKVIDTNLVIEKYSDGRVKGLGDNLDLNESQINKILKEMRFNDDEINRMPENLKQDLVKSGGVKVDLNTTTSEEYRSLDGNLYEVNNSNREAVEKLKESDLKSLNNVNNSMTRDVTPLGGTIKGEIEGYHSLIYSGLTSNGLEHKYSLLTYYSSPSVLTVDVRVATAWTVDMVRTNARAYYYFNSNQYSGSVDTSSVYGTSTKYPYAMTRGYLQNDVNIPKSKTGLTGQFTTKVAVPYNKLDWILPSVAIGPISITFSSYLGTTYSMDSTFEIGKSYLN